MVSFGDFCFLRYWRYRGCNRLRFLQGRNIMKHRLFKQVTAVALTAVLLATGINMESFNGFMKAEKSTLTTEVKGQEKQTKKEKEPTVVKELEDLRTADSTTYLLSNGFRRVEYYSDNIRYEKDGKYVAYNPALKKMTDTEKNQLKKQVSGIQKIGKEEIEQYVYTNKAGDARHYFPESLKNTGILLERNEYVIQFVPVVQEDGVEMSENEKEDSNKATKENVEQADREAESEETTDKKTEDIQENKQEENKITKIKKTENTNIVIKETDQNEIIYENKGEETSYKYISNHDGVKEEIILNRQPENNTFRFEINAEGLGLSKTEYDKTIRFTDLKTKRQIAYIDEPNIKDRNGEISYSEVVYELEKITEDKYGLKIVVDKEYLEKAQYPVVIDPTVVWFDSRMESAAVSNMPYTTSMNMKNTSFMEVQNKCNNIGPYVGTEKYCYIDTSNVLKANAMSGATPYMTDMYVEKATLRLREYEKNGYSPQEGVMFPYTPGTVEIRSIEGEWSPDTVTWNNHPEMGDKVWAEFQCTGIKLKEHTIDMTDWVKKVVQEKIPNHGLALKAKEENTGNTFYSSRINMVKDDKGNLTGTYMYLSIDYRDAARYYGIDGVYAPTGNYTETSSDMSVQTVIGDISITRIYNSLNSNNKSTVGKGFELNYGMKVISKEDKARVIMPNSTRWNFRKVFEKYEALDNKGTLIYENNKYRLVTIDMTEYGFDTNGYLSYVKDYEGNQINITTDSDGKVQRITDSSGTFIRFSYTGSKLTKAEEVKNGSAIQEASYTYEGEQLVKVSYPGGQETHYEYTGGRLSRVSNSGKNNQGTLKSLDITYYTDGVYEGMVKSVENAIGVKSTYTYDFENYTTTVNDSNTKESGVRRIRYTYNDNLAVTKEEDLKLKIENKQVSEIEYSNSTSEDIDPDRPLSSKDQYGNVTSYEYDENGNLTKTIYPDGSTETATYDEETNDVLTSMDRNGLLTENTYADGLLTEVKTGGLVTATYSYYPETTYGIEGLVKRETDAHGNITEYEYDTKGNVTKTKQFINGASHDTTNTYDDKGQLIKTVDPEGIKTEYIYNESGAVLLTKVQDKNGKNIQITRNVHDVLGREIQVIGPAVYDAAKDNLDADLYSDKTAGACTTYNDKGQVISEKDVLGNETTYVYDADGNIEKEIKPNNTYYISEYDKDGRKTEEIFYENGDTIGLILTSMVYAEDKNQVTTKTYMDNGWPSATVQEYDWEGNVIREETQSGLVKTSSYENGLLMRESTKEKGIAIEKAFTEYTYDIWGRTLSKTESFDETGNSKTKYTYDNYGNVLTESVKNNAAGGQETYATTTHEYDSQDNEIKTIIPNGRYIQHYYRWDGKILRDYKGMTSPLTIQGLDDVADTGSQKYSVIKYEYDAMGRLSKKTDPLGKSETYSYDKAGREKVHVDKNGVCHTTEYDEGDNPVKAVSKKEGNSVPITKEYTYDNMGNVATEKEGNTTTSYTYDGRNNCIKEVSGNVVKEYQYNNSDMVMEYKISIDGIQKQKVTNTYDRCGNVTHVYENDALKAVYEYDKWGQVIKTTSGNGNIEERTYNAAGLVTSVVNRRGTDVLSQYAYTYYYDEKERTKTDSSGTIVYLYDKAGELEKEVKIDRNRDNITKEKAAVIVPDVPEHVSIEKSGETRYYTYTPVVTFSYTIQIYNNSNELKMSIYEDETLVYEENADIQDGGSLSLSYTFIQGKKYVISLKKQTGKGSFNFVIKQSGRTNTSHNNAKIIVEDVPECVVIEQRGQTRYYGMTAKVSGMYTIEGHANGVKPIVTLYTGSGTYLAGGTNSSGTDSWGKVQYQLMEGERYVVGVSVYGSIGSLILDIESPAHEKKNVTEYAYDGNGNRTELSECEKGNVKETTYTYDKNDRLLMESSGDNTVTYTYDDNGNMLEKSDGTEQTFDLLGRMESYKSAEGVTTTYGYYADDMRKSKKTGNSAVIEQIWIEDDIALELESGEVRSTYVHGENLICSAYGWYLYNAHGDVTALTANNGTITKNYEYDSFGAQKSATDDADENPYRYSGEYYDTESGYTYLQARYYDPDMGRFISEDPAMDGENWYVYCGNDPVNMVDPTGMWSKEIHKKMSTKALNDIEELLEWAGGEVPEKLLLGSTYPDRIKKYQTVHKWHGHKGYIKVKNDQLKKAVKAWMNGKKKKAYHALGKGLHTIQDHYAHTFVKDGKTVNTWSYVKGRFFNEKKTGAVIAGKYPQYISEQFMGQLQNSGENYIGKTVHKFTADNIYASFSNKDNKWIWNNKKSKRYKKAVSKSKAYLKKFVKKVKAEEKKKKKKKKKR